MQVGWQAERLVGGQDTGEWTWYMWVGRAGCRWLASSRPYSTTLLVVGQAGDTCYSFKIPTSGPLTWYVAADACVADGGHLASLNTPREWSHVKELIWRTRPRSEDVYVGLKSPSPVLPPV